MNDMKTLIIDLIPLSVATRDRVCPEHLTVALADHLSENGSPTDILNLTGCPSIERAWSFMRTILGLYDRVLFFVIDHTMMASTELVRRTSTVHANVAVFGSSVGAYEVTGNSSATYVPELVTKYVGNVKVYREVQDCLPEVVGFSFLSRIPKRVRVLRTDWALRPEPTVFLGNKCRAKCTFCRDDFKKRTETDVAVEDVLSYLNSHKKVCVQSASFCDHPNWEAVASHGSKLKYVQVKVQDIEKLSKYADNIDSVCVGYERVDKETQKLFWKVNSSRVTDVLMSCIRNKTFKLISVHVIVGAPGETVERINQLISFSNVVLESGGTIDVKVYTHGTNNRLYRLDPYVWWENLPWNVTEMSLLKARNLDTRVDAAAKRLLRMASHTL